MIAELETEKIILDKKMKKLKIKRQFGGVYERHDQ